MKKVSKKDYLIIHQRYEPMISYMVPRFGITQDEIISVIYNYNTKFRREEFSDYLMRVCLKPKGFKFEDLEVV